MFTATQRLFTADRPPATTSRGTWPPPDEWEPSPTPPTSAAARAFLLRITATLLPLAATAAGLEAGWQLLAADTWATALGVVAGWALAAVGWLRRRAWRGGAVLVVIGTPAAMLAASAVPGWLSPAGLVLWAPVSTVLAVALVMAAHPVPPAGPHPPARPCSRPDRPAHPRSPR